MGELPMGRIKPTVCALLLCFVVSTASALGLEERVEALEEKVQALTELTRGIKQTTSLQENASDENTDSQDGQIPDTKPFAPMAPDERKPDTVVSITLADVTYHEPNRENEMTDWLSLRFICKNNLEKPMRAVKGVVVFYDLFDEEWWRIDLTVTEPLEPGEYVPCFGKVDYRSFSDAPRKAKNTDPKDIIVVFEVSQVLYRDGAKESFE
jgi:hypothetical protein